MIKHRNYQERELPDFLEKRRKENPFRVPYHYFKELPDKILTRLYENEKTEESGFSHWLRELWVRFYSPQVAIVVSGILLLLLALPFLMNRKTAPADDFGLEADDIAFYINANIDDFDEELFYSTDLDQFSLFPELELEEEQLDQMIEEIMYDLDVETLKEML